jgi:hypothetical protein
LIAIVALLIAIRRRTNPIGWILLVGVAVSSFDLASQNSTADRIPGTGTLWQYGRINALNAVCWPKPVNLHVVQQQTIPATGKSGPAVRAALTSALLVCILPID